MEFVLELMVLGCSLANSSMNHFPFQATGKEQARDKKVLILKQCENNNNIADISL